jgi:hypothetical protein
MAAPLMSISGGEAEEEAPAGAGAGGGHGGVANKEHAREAVSVVEGHGSSAGGRRCRRELGN